MGGPGSLGPLGSEQFFSGVHHESLVIDVSHDLVNHVSVLLQILGVNDVQSIYIFVRNI